MAGVWTLTTSTAAPSTRPTLPTTAPRTASSSITTPWSGAEPRVYSVPCDDSGCPPNSFCSNDYQRGGSRCHCNLGYHGNLCSEGDMLKTNMLMFYNDRIYFIRVCLCMCVWVCVCFLQVCQSGSRGFMDFLTWHLSPWRTRTRVSSLPWSSRSNTLTYTHTLFLSLCVFITFIT